MLDLTGNLTKLNTKLDNNLAVYDLGFNNNKNIYNLNQYINKTKPISIAISIEYLNIINCINCERITKKSFNQGYCFPCFRKLASCDSCIMSPERCHYHLGTCREPEWGLKHCMQDHIVYLANSGDIKVGLTRASQIPTRWIDQGATQALIIARVSTRYQAGLLEVICKAYIKDRTNWRAMLKSSDIKLDLHKARDDIYSKIKEKIAELSNNINNQITWCIDEKITEINYPVMQYPSKVTSFNLEVDNKISGKLLGIKGQYLILDTGVINIRKYTGYKVRIIIN